MRDQAIRARFALGLLAVFGLLSPGRPAAAQGAGQAPQITVGGVTQVSKAYEKRAHAEVILATDPVDPRRLLAGSMVINPGIGASVAAYISADGGKSWELALEKRAEKAGQGYADPTCAFGPDGRAYFAALVSGTSSEVSASGDGGRTWGTPTLIREMSDRPFLAVDCTDGPTRGWVYCFGDARGPAVFRSRDEARAFELMARPAVAGSDQGKLFGSGVVLSDGTVVAPCHVMTKVTEQQYSLRVVRSNTGGESFLGEQLLADYHADNIQSGVIPILAVDPASGSFRDRLYLVWCDRTESGQRVVVMLSKDKGASWTKPSILSDDSRAGAADKDASHHAYLPTVAVNRAGIVAVTWYDGTLRDKTLRSHLRFRASSDGGTTWLPSVAVTDFVDASYPEDSWVGHTAGLAADAAGAFHPLWVDNRTGIRQVFTATAIVK